MRLLSLLLPAFTLLAACDQLGIETPAQELLRMEAEGKAIGSSCRHAGRALEDCYQINPKASKAAVFTGWRDMDAYMRENKITEVAPQFPMQLPQPKKKKSAAAEEGAAAADKADAPAEAKAAEKHTALQEPASAGKRTAI
jgi:hypothetical protein